MRRICSLILAFMILFTLCACQGNFGSVNLQEPVPIPEDGVITERILSQIKTNHAIGTFTGVTGDISYEWVIFGSDLHDTGDVNLKIQTEADGDALKVTLQQKEAFGFSALLSIRLNTQWDAQSATAFAGDKAIASVSVTGSDTTVLNLTLDGTVSTLEIRPDPLPEEAVPETTAPETEASAPGVTQDDYLSRPQNGSSDVYTGEKDQYLTDPVPEGKPKPVEPENQDVNQQKILTCTFSIECTTILNNLDQLDPEKLEMVPSGGVILAKTTVTFYEGESVYDVLQRICKDQGIHLESAWTPIYNSAYIEGIHNLYEFDCGSLSGWMYRVNGWYPNYGCSRYQLKDGDTVEWRYTCDLGNDVGGGYAVGG